MTAKNLGLLRDLGYAIDRLAATSYELGVLDTDNTLHEQRGAMAQQRGAARQTVDTLLAQLIERMP